jgi:hypothetical protein
MRRGFLPLCAAALMNAVALVSAGRSGDAGTPASIVALALAPEADERRPVEVPTEPENTTEIDFPWPVDDWAGRGFTPDAERFAGDFVIEAVRGRARIFVTPVAAGAHRVLHVVLSGPGGATRSVALEFIPAPAGLAWRKVVLVAGSPAPPPPRPSVALVRKAPESRLREASAESELGLMRTMRLLLNTTSEGAADIAAANPALALKALDGTPRSFGDFSISNRFAVRDATTGTLGLCVSVSNGTARRLLFDPVSWVIRCGARAYPVGTVDFADELEAGASAPAILILARGPDGEPTRLAPDNDFRASVIETDSLNPRPVRLVPIEGLDPR